MADLPPGSVLLKDYPDRVGRVRYALSPDGQVWRLIHSGGGLKLTTELPRPIKPVFLGSRGRRYPFYKIGLPGKHGSKAIALSALMREHFPLAQEP